MNTKQAYSLCGTTKFIPESTVLTPRVRFTIFKPYRTNGDSSRATCKTGSTRGVPASKARACCWPLGRDFPVTFRFYVKRPIPLGVRLPSRSYGTRRAPRAQGLCQGCVRMCTQKTGYVRRGGLPQPSLERSWHV